MKVDTLTAMLLASVGFFMEVTAGYWDVYSHQLQPMDPWWNPAHLTIYCGIALVLAAVSAWRLWGDGDVAVRPAMWAMALGAALQLAAGAFNEAWHALGGPSMTLEPPHVVLVLGMITGVFGAVTGLATLRGARVLRGLPRSRTVDAALLLAFLTTWLVTAGSGIYTAYVLEGGAQGALLLVVAAIAPLILVPCARTLRTAGSLTLLGGAYGGINWVLLVVYLGAPPYFPWTIPAVAALEGVELALRKRLPPIAAAAAVGLTCGLLFHWIFFPFTYDLASRGVVPVMSPGLAVAGLLGGLVAHLLIRLTLSWVTQGRPLGTTGPPGPAT